MQVPILGITCLERGTPPPPVYWNVEVRGKFENNLWRSVSYGQNLQKERVRSQPKVRASAPHPSGWFQAGAVDVKVRCHRAEPEQGRKPSSFARRDSRVRLSLHGLWRRLRFLAFTFQSALQRLVKRGFGFVILLLADPALFVFDFQFEEFVFQALQ